MTTTPAQGTTPQGDIEWYDKDVIRVTMGITPDMDRLIRLRRWITADRQRLIAEADKLRAELAEMKALIAFMDKWVPLADDTCAEPGITYSEACKRAMKEEMSDE